MKNKRLWLGLGWLVLAALTACAPIEAPAVEDPSPSPGAPAATSAFKVTPLAPTQIIGVTPVNTSRPPSGPTPSVPAGLLAIAAADLSARLSIPADQIEVVSFESVVWPDSSLGCPQPGMQYLQVLSEGYRLQLQAGKQVYTYHGGERRDPFLCENPSPAVGSPR